MADKTIKVTLNAVDNVSAKFKAVSDSATTMGDALEKSGAESAKGMDQLGKSAETNTKAMGSMKAEAAAVGAVLGVLAAGAMKAGEASQNQARQLLVLSRLYGDAASSMDQYANKIQETTRFSNDQAREAEIIFATLHNNYGVAQDDIQRLVSISADLAESYGMSITDAAQRIQSAIRGEAEAAEALGLTMNQQAIDRNNLTLSMSNQEAAQFRLNALWEQTANLQGVAAQRANSAAGEFRQFTNTMQDGVQAVGDFIGPFGQIAAEMAPIALAAPVAGAAVGTLVGRLKESKLAMSALGAVTSPVGLAITGVVAALGVAGYAFLKNKEDAAQAKAAWDAAGASIDALAQKSMEMALAGQTGAAGWAGNIANETKSFFEGMNQELAQLKEDLDHTVDPSTMTGASKAYFEAFLAEAQRNKGMMSEWLTAQITLDPTDSSKMVIDWANTLNTPETQAAIGSSLSDLFSLSSNPYVDQDKLRSETNRIVSEMLTTKDVTGARAELTSLYEELAAGAEKASASAQKLKQDFSFDDLKGQGKLELANDLKAVSSELDNIATGWQKVNVTARTMNALPAEDQAAVLEHNAAAMQMSVELAGQYAEAQERINEKVASGQYDNKQIAADLAAINQQRLVNIATGMDAAKANDLAARAVVELSKGTADYTKVLTDAQQAQVSFTTSGANILDFYNRLQEAMSKTLNVSSSERAVSELAMGLDRTGKSLDSVLTTFSRIDALGSRSSSAASIAESMIGNADELGALPKLMDDIAAGTSRATLSQQDYIQAMGAGRAIIASNVQVQGLLTSIRAKQLPYLAAQQVAYEGNIAALERMNASDQRRVLMLQDTTVQQGLAAAGALQLQSAYTSMTQAQVDQLATQALLNPEVAEALELYKALRVNADGYYEVLTANGQWATSSIRAVTDNVTWQREATEAAAGSWEAWKAEAAAAGMTAEELEKNLEGLKGTLIEVSGLGDSLAGIGMMGLGSESTGLAGNLIQSGAALESAYRVIVSNTEGIKGQFQELYDWGEKLIGEEGVWSRMDDLDALGLLKPGQWREAQDAFNVITQLNEQVANSIDAIQVGLAPVLTDAAEKQAAYIEQLRGMGEAQQLATLGWMDSAESARAFELATLAADAAAGKFGDTGMEMANQAILAAANMDPVIAKMLESIGLIKEVDGEYVVQFDAVDNASGTIESLNTSLKIFTLLAMGVPPAVIKAEVQGKGDVDDLYESMLGVPAHKTSSIDVTVNSTGVDEAGNKIQTLTLADGTTVTVLVGASGTDSLIDADSTSSRRSRSLMAPS